MKTGRGMRLRLHPLFLITEIRLYLITGWEIGLIGWVFPEWKQAIKREISLFAGVSKMVTKCSQLKNYRRLRNSVER